MGLPQNKNWQKNIFEVDHIIAKQLIEHHFIDVKRSNAPTSNVGVEFLQKPDYLVSISVPAPTASFGCKNTASFIDSEHWFWNQLPGGRKHQKVSRFNQVDGLAPDKSFHLLRTS